MAHEGPVSHSPRRIDQVDVSLRLAPVRWLVTGAAGFIGSHLVERLLNLDQRVVGLDNFTTGSPHNLNEIVSGLGAVSADRFRFLEGDIRELTTCRRACEGVSIVLHQAALGSVPRSIEDPKNTNAVNIDGFLNMLIAARDAGIGRFVYASSSAVYGDDPRLPKREGNEGRPLSPYAVTKAANELYAAVFQRSYGLRVVGLRYFNVFGPRQDPEGPYAAVIPRWIRSLMIGEPCRVFGDGETSRDFCYVANAVQANLLAAQCPDGATGAVYNVSYGGRTTLNQLYDQLRGRLERLRHGAPVGEKIHDQFRPGDVRHSHASLTKVKEALGYAPTHDLARGLAEAMPWYVKHAG